MFPTSMWTLKSIIKYIFAFEPRKNQAHNFIFKLDYSIAVLNIFNKSNQLHFNEFKFALLIVIFCVSVNHTINIVLIILWYILYKRINVQYKVYNADFNVNSENNHVN